MDTQNISNLQSSTNTSRTRQSAERRSPQVNDGAELKKDQLDIRPTSAEDARKLLNTKILASINLELGNDGQTQIEALDSTDYTPEKVANRILNFIQVGIARLAGQDATDERKSELLNKAIAGVEKGLADAQEILSGLGVLNGEIEEDIEATTKLLYEGFDELKAQLGLNNTEPEAS